MGAAISAGIQYAFRKPLGRAWTRNVTDPLNRPRREAERAAQEAQAAIESEAARAREEKKRIGPAASFLDGSEDADAVRRRRLSSLRAGIYSTVRTSPGGVGGGATLLTPQAIASGLKTRLGQ